jgi:hypothetical protein
LFVVALVVIVTMVVAVVATDGPVIVLMMRMAVLVAAILAPVAMIHVVAKLVLIALIQSVEEFAFSVRLNLCLTLLCERVVGHLQVKNILKVLVNGLKFFIA